jgi:hydrogenase maturation protease
MLDGDGAINPRLEGLERPVPRAVTAAGREISPGTRVRLRPRSGGDIMDIALAGKIAIVEAIEQDYDEKIHLAVTIEDDPGRDLGREHWPGHRFFFSPDEVEPVIGEQE